MKFGALFLTDPPASRFIELAKRAEAAGFDYVWTADSHIIWQEPWPLFGVLARETKTVKFGPLVTNPGTRDATVVASLVATLNDLAPGRVVCGIGRGDSARRTAGKKPVTVKEFETAIRTIKALVRGEEADFEGTTVKLPWATGFPLEMWGAGYGPRVLDVVGRTCEGFVLQLADPDVLAWTRAYVRRGAEQAGRDPDEVQVMVAAPPYVSDDMAHAHEQLRWFAGSVANHVADLVRHYGGSDIPSVLTDYIENRPAYDYAFHGRAHNPRTDYVPDEINRRFCVMGGVEEHIEKLRHLSELGVDMFTGYFIHDDVEGTLDAYGSKVIPAVR